MLKRLHIRNFRGFNALKIDQLSGINLIVGKNNSGKTSLLETIFLLFRGGNAQVAINDNVIRGLKPRDISTGDPFWKQLFSDLDMRQCIEIEADHTSHGQLTLEISSKRQHTTEFSLDHTNGTSITNRFDERLLVFQYSGPSRKSVKSHIRMKEQGFEVNQPTINFPFQAIMLSSQIGNIQEDAIRLGRLRRQKQGDMLLKALQVVEPKLQSIEDNSSSGIPLIWGDIGLSELVPLSVMGESMTQITRLVLAIASVPEGVVLVDDVDIGIHHSVLPDVWRVIDEAARQFRTQIFATTHSFECVMAAHESLSKDRFRLHRLEIADQTNRCVTYEPHVINAAIRHNLEVR
ncbi:MAG: ATP-binding protein [Candidatus Poribacteria bacterium]|nr:ATP-binding protein [Candidatus Poribacteria bacterium]